MAFVARALSVQVVEASPDRLNVSGALVFETAREAYQAGLRTLRNGGTNSPLQVDCAGVNESDSAGLAVLLEWLATAVKAGRKIQFANLPEGIKAAAEISEVAEILEAGA